jgi:nondiscriminating aspartyl-tRNA synthetase
MAILGQRALAADLPHRIGESVELRGWLNTVRSMGKLCFVILRDRSGFAQITIEDRSEAKVLLSLHPGSVLHVQGEVRAAPEADLGVEVIHPKITVEVPIQAVSPIEYNKPRIPSDLEYILDHRALALRNREIQAVFRVQAEIAHAYRLFMHDTIGAIEYFPPNIIGSSSEGGAEFFNVDYFGYNATLAQSSQLYKQIMVGVNERVFAITPFFRAEKSHTPRHLTEGKQLEFEMGFFDSWRDLLQVLEECIQCIVGHLQEHCSRELTTLGGQLVRCPADVPFPRLTFAEAQELYFQRTGVDDRAEPDLSPAAERALCEWARETHGTDFVFVTDWLLAKRPFYSYPNPDDPTRTHTFDLLCAGTEIVSGGERRHTEESLIEGIVSKGMDPAAFEDYISIFRYGMPAHGGFGMGLERLTMTLLHLKNIREASLFPSDPKRIAGTRLRAKIVFGQEGIRNEIIRLLRAQDVSFEIVEHLPAGTSEESTAARDLSRSVVGIKALILRGKSSKRAVQVCIPADQRLDMKAVAALVGEKCEFEQPDLIQERYGLTVGGIPPFGPLLALETFFDSSLEGAAEVAFNCGFLTESIICPGGAVSRIVQPTFAPVTKREPEA